MCLDYFGLFFWVGPGRGCHPREFKGNSQATRDTRKNTGVSRYATSPVGVNSKKDEDGSMQIGPEGSQPSIFQGSTYGSNRKTNAKVMGV